MNMQRKYVYLVVSLLIIAVVLFQEQQRNGIDLKNNKPTEEIKLNDDYLSIEEEKNSFVVNNYQNDDIEKEYSYELVIDGASGAYEATIWQQIDDTQEDFEQSYVIFTANGHGTFKLKSNESITIIGLPKDKAYTIVQKNKYDNYTITINDEVKNQTSGITGVKTEITIKNNISTPTPSDKIEEKETNKKRQENKDKGPNTAVISSIVVIGVIVSFIIGYLLTKIKIKRFE